MIFLLDAKNEALLHLGGKVAFCRALVCVENERTKMCVTEEHLRSRACDAYLCLECLRLAWSLPGSKAEALELLEKVL